MAKHGGSSPRMLCPGAENRSHLRFRFSERFRKISNSRHDAEASREPEPEATRVRISNFVQLLRDCCSSNAGYQRLFLEAFQPFFNSVSLIPRKHPVPDICSREYRKKTSASRRRLEIVKSCRSNSNFKLNSRSRVGLKSPPQILRARVSQG